MPVYLDHNATTPLDEAVLEAMLPYLRHQYGNPSSVHAFGRAARAAVDQAREWVAQLAGAHPSQVVFTSGGTGANNLALKGAAGAFGSTGRIWISAVEHPSVVEPARALQRQGWLLNRLAVDGNGLVAAQSLADMRALGADIVSVMWANNETGVIQDVQQVSACAGEAVVHVDAVQAAGKIALDFAQSGAHLMSLSAHKIHGPKGIGALIARRSVALEPLLHGGGQERGFYCGTENVPAIVGFGKAAELARERVGEAKNQLLLRQRLEQGLSGLPGVTLFASQVERLPNTVMFGVSGIEGESLLMLLDQAGFAVSSGSACGSARVDASPVLKAMNVPLEVARTSIRVSLGRQNTEADVDGFLRVLASLTTARANMAATG